MVSYCHFVVEGPAAVQAAVELAVLFDGVLYQVKRRPLSAFGADHRVTFSFFFSHHAWCFYCFCLHHSIIILHNVFCFRLKKTRQIYKIPIISASKTPSDAFFCKFCHIFVNSATPPLSCTFRPLIKNSLFHRGNGGASSRARHLSAEN